MAGSRPRLRLPARSFRTRVLALVLAVATLPLLVLGLWLTGRTARSGEALLRERLDLALEEAAASVIARWIPYRSALLDLVETEDVRAALAAGLGPAREQSDTAAEVGDDPAAEAPPSLAAAFRDLDMAIAEVTVRGAAGDPGWSFRRAEGRDASVFGAPLSVRLPVFDAEGRRLGILEARMRFVALRDPSAGAGAGAVVSALDPTTGAVLLPVPFDPTLVGRERFRWNGEEWVGRSRQVPEPPVTLTAAAPVAPFAGPFEAEGRRSLSILLAVAGLGLVAAVVLTGRLTGSLERLAEAARAVTAGDLSRTVRVGADDEVGAVAEAFNTMVESLRRTLRQLAERESLAAVNEFAASLAHEIRNPLTSVQLDLQQVEEALPEGSPWRALQGEAIREMRRLDRTVAGALEAARSGPVEPRRVDVLEPIRRAVRRARPHAEEKGARLGGPEREEPLWVAGDADALEQLFLNLLLNAVEAVEEGQRVTVTAEERAEAAVMLVRDEGRGIPEGDRKRIFEPFFTTRPGGTGLGLVVARRIVVAHRGAIRVSSRAGAGTTVEVELPRGAGTGTNRSPPRTGTGTDRCGGQVDLA